ncbi:hypothetical protein ACLK17_03105 [Escherichia coli]
MAELTAAGVYMQYWFPDVRTWISAAAFFIIINAVNLVNRALIWRNRVLVCVD